MNIPGARQGRRVPRWAEEPGTRARAPLLAQQQLRCLMQGSRQQFVELPGCSSFSVRNEDYTTTPQAGLNDRVLSYSRVHIVDDFNRYAELTGDMGWSWNESLPYFLKNEKWSSPADHHDTQMQFDPSVHSTRGLTSVSLNGFQWPIFQRNVIQTTKELPDTFPFNLDMNSGKPLGLGWLQSTIGDGMRSSSATSYLAPEFIQRKNLHILLNAHVSELVNPGNATGTSTFTATASKEIILSAGAVGTPNILLHSGIGDRNILDTLGIPTLLHLPSVGQNVSDQVLLSASWAANFNQTLDSTEWNKSHTGPLVAFGPTHVAWLRLDPDSPIFENHTDPSAGPFTPHLEVAFTPRIGGFGPGDSEPGHFVSAGLAVVTPVSRGSITINSSDPFASSLIDIGLLRSDFDLFAMREALKRAQQFFKAPVWRDYIIGPTQDLENITSDALDQLIRNTAVSSLHLVGSAGMTARDAEYGVVNPDLLVKGVDGLRIIDASVLPVIPSAHTQAATYVVAERGADLIKQKWK
ncbi:aryl-alcohol oxidase-like protein [Mycena vulgaris]|nr:aryl-alcohol oxidase-like protein [Mycena vulgaris]